MSKTKPLAMQRRLQKKLAATLSNLSKLIAVSLLVFSVLALSSCFSDELEIYEDDRVYTEIGSEELGYFDIVEDSTDVEYEDGFMKIHGKDLFSDEDYTVLLFDLEEFEEIVTSDNKPDLDEVIKNPHELTDLGLRFIETLKNENTYVENMGVGDGESDRTYGILVTIEGYNGDALESFEMEPGDQSSFFIMKNNKVIYVDKINQDSTSVVTSYRES